MAETLADVKITASTDAEAKRLIAMLSGQGATNISKILSSSGRAMVSGQVPTANLPAVQAGIPTGQQAMYKTNESAAAAAATSLGQRLRNAFTMKNAKEMNRSLFMLQMSSLGVVFSFTSIINSVMGLFSGLEDLGGMISAGAMGTAFAGLATGGANTTDIAGMMGVTPEMATAAWAGFTAIVNQFKTLIDSLMVKVLSPEMVAAILAVIDALASQLAKPEVTKAIQEIIKSVLELALAIIPLIPVLAELINWLGDTGLLKFFLLIILAAQILLPLLAYLQFAFTAIMTVAELLTAASILLAIPMWAIIAVIGIVVLAIDFLIHLFENLNNGMSLLDAVTNAFGQTLADVVNLIIGLINPLLGFLGMGKIDMWSTKTGYEPEATQKATTIVNNINFNKSVNTSDKQQVANAAIQVGNASMG